MGRAAQALEPPEDADFVEVMRTNVLPAMRIAPRLLAALERGKGSFAVLSSRMGAIGPRTGTAGWLYRASKAALNSVLKDMSLVAGARGITCVAFHPGWVKTDMGGKGADVDVETSVTGMRRTLAALDASHNGPLPVVRRQRRFPGKGLAMLMQSHHEMLRESVRAFRACRARAAGRAMGSRQHLSARAAQGARAAWASSVSRSRTHGAAPAWTRRHSPSPAKRCRRATVRPAPSSQ